MENKRYHIVIASIIFAILMWVSVNMRDEYSVVRHIPVVLENIKEGKALKYPVPKTVSVRFRGTGWLLAGLYLTPGVKYFIDVSSLSTEAFIVTGRDLLEHIKLPFAIQPLDVRPDTLVLALEEYKEKRVPVIPKFLMDVHEGYGQVGPTRIMPESVTVGGSDLAIGGITAWHTVFKKFDDLRGSVDAMIDLEESPSYSIDLLTRVVRTEINVQPFAEKTFPGIPLTATGVPANLEVFFIPPKIDIIDQLSKLSAEDFHPTVSFQLLLSDSMQSVFPVLIPPEEIKIVSKKPERFQYIVRKRL
jgi:YbbR domain-containing protein